MNRHPSTKEHRRKATPYNTQHTSTVVEVIARCRYALIVHGWDGQSPRREEVDEEEEKHCGLTP